ncbi:fructose bisphosphate aldolase [Demequina sp.]|uniref:fructose bisphosphate aldolase n=1 Tax=Demequina sp. TaxID=2050685 RepID=UPI0025BD7664|nr:fructose bisphosphate aldolase [Demequina sp.]
MNTEQLEKIKSGKGFIAALDQSGGSTPKALKLFGISEKQYSNEDEMFELMHQMRTRIMTSPAFTGERILGAILFEMTMDREIGGKGTAEYLWEDKKIVPFLKVDKGLAEPADGSRTMNPLPDLEAVLAKAKTHGVFGTKMRSVIRLANKAGVQAVVDQQFQVARRILEQDMMPIIEPEVDVFSPEKALAENMLKGVLLDALDQLDPGQQVMLKVSLPDKSDLHAELVAHPNVLRVVALSGGYTRENANYHLTRNHGVVASFSRALTEGLTAQQSQEEFDAALDASIASIYEASLG